MVINMVIVEDNVERGRDMGELLAGFVGKTCDRPWRMSVHVRRNINRTTDDNFKRYEG